jgi:replication factor C subunit 2/4
MSKIPFIDKYKPRHIEDLILDEIPTNFINKIVITKNIPNIIFVGNVGVSKTITVYCLMRKLFHRKNIRDAFIEFNAFGDRGIKINDPIINFCKKKIFFEDDYIQNKVLFFDDADNITQKTQKIICSNMEKFRNCRFVFTCNKITEIIESIKSRCIVIHFKSCDRFVDKLEYICTSENKEYDMEALQYLFQISNKDYRMSINLLDLICSTENKITIEKINNICGIPQNEIFEKLLCKILEKDYSAISTILLDFKNNGLFSFDVLVYFIQFITNYKNIDEEVKIKIVDILSKKAFNMNKSICSNIQLTSAIFQAILV